MRPQPFVTNIAVNSFADVIKNLEMVVHNTNMQQRNNLLWQGAKAALEYMQAYKDLRLVEIVLDGARRDNLVLQFIKTEGDLYFDEDPILRPWPGQGSKWLLGPFLASVQKPGQNPAQAAQAKDAQSPPRDGSPESPAPVETSDLPVPIVD